MTVLPTLRQKHKDRSRTVVVLLLVVWLNLALQACAATAPISETTGTQATTSATLDFDSTHAEHDRKESCQLCPSCVHGTCTENGTCDGGTVAAVAKPETRFPDTHQIQLIAAGVDNDDGVAAISRSASPRTQPSYLMTAAAVPLTIRYCTFLI